MIGNLNQEIFWNKSVLKKIVLLNSVHYICTVIYYGYKGQKRTGQTGQKEADH